MRARALHIEVGPFDRRRIMKHQEDTGDGENDEEKAGDSAEAEGIGESKAMALHLRRERYGGRSCDTSPWIASGPYPVFRF